MVVVTRRYSGVTRDYVTERVRVVSPEYGAAPYGRSFVGEFLDGNLAGRGETAIQYSSITGLDVK